MLNIMYLLFVGSLFYWYTQDSMHWFRYEPKGDFNDQHNGFNDFKEAPEPQYSHQHNVVSIQWHSVTAFSAFVLCMSEAMVTYRTWEKAYGLAHFIAKDLHASLLWMATSLLVAAIIFGREHAHWAGHDHDYSPHSWQGILTASMVAIQIIGGMVFYTFASGETKRELLPYHKLFGLLTYASGINCCIMGILQNLYLIDCTSQYCKEHIWSDLLAIEIEVIAIIVVCVTLSEDDGSEYYPQEALLPLVGTLGSSVVHLDNDGIEYLQPERAVTQSNTFVTLSTGEGTVGKVEQTPKKYKKGNKQDRKIEKEVSTSSKKSEKV